MGIQADNLPSYFSIEEFNDNDITVKVLVYNSTLKKVKKSNVLNQYVARVFIQDKTKPGEAKVKDEKPSEFIKRCMTEILKDNEDRGKKRVEEVKPIYDEIREMQASIIKLKENHKNAGEDSNRQTQIKEKMDLLTQQIKNLEVKIKDIDNKYDPDQNLSQSISFFKEKLTQIKDYEFLDDKEITG